MVLERHFKDNIFLSMTKAIPEEMNILSGLLKRLVSFLPDRGLILREVENFDDVEFVIERCIAESRSGHFSRDISATPEALNGLRLQIAAAVNHYPFPFGPGNPRNGTGARLAIAQTKKTRIGFVLLLEDMPGSWENSVEIYLLSIIPEARGRGLGTQLIDMLLSHLTARTIYARCFQQSGQMIHILEKFGFVCAYDPFSGHRKMTYLR